MANAKAEVNNVKAEPVTPNQDGQQNQNHRNQNRKRNDNYRGQNHQGNMRGGPGNMMNQRAGIGKDMIRERLANLGPTINLTTREGTEPRKFTGRCRLFVGNLPNNTTEEDFKKMFEEFGEIAEVFLNRQKGFGFVKVDTRQNAENAKAALDFSLRDGKYLRVRFATHGAALKVKNLTPWISNELLEAAFSIFGDIERSVVIVDDRGRPIGEGIVEFSRKQAAQLALKRCTEGCFLLTSSPRPVLVEPLEQRDEEDGFPEKNFQKNSPEYLKERDIGPRFAEPGTFEFEFCNRWKKLAEVERQKRDHLEKEIIEARQQLDDQQEFAIYEHETNMLREKLRMMEEQSSLLKREREMRREDELRREEQRHQEEMMLRQKQEEILRRRNEEQMRHRQDNMMMQQNSMGDLMDRQDTPMRRAQIDGRRDPESMAGYDMDSPQHQMMGRGQAGNNAVRQSRFDQPQNMGQNMGVPGSPMAYPMAGLRGGPRDMHGADPRDMMDPRDLREEYDMEAKRRRF